MNRCRSQWRNRGPIVPGPAPGVGARATNSGCHHPMVAVGWCDGSALVGKAQAAAAGRRIGPGPKELPHPKDGKNPQNSRKNPPSPSEDSFIDPSAFSPDLIQTMVKKSNNIKNRLTCFAILGSPITRHPSIQRLPQLSRPPRNHRHAQRCQQREFQTGTVAKNAPTRSRLAACSDALGRFAKTQPEDSTIHPIQSAIRNPSVIQKISTNGSSCLFNSKISDVDL